MHSLMDGIEFKYATLLLEKSLKLSVVNVSA